MIVDSIMSRNVRAIGPDATVREAATEMRTRRIGCLIVAKGDEPVGIVTERDLVQRVLAEARDPERTRVAEIMSTPLATIEPSAHVDEAAAMMQRIGVKRLVVVLGDELRGIVTATDVAYARPEVSRELLETWVKPRWED
ncbi:MAG TPA: CBS domain-containing protein [Candidatus Thermoplasmatota archaeon]|nr:CBS domain-containing protein [Candidatus Thermoplasmatota archaeon]